jgi:hypothetical protein
MGIGLGEEVTRFWTGCSAIMPKVMLAAARSLALPKADGRTAAACHAAAVHQNPPSLSLIKIPFTGIRSSVC